VADEDVKLAFSAISEKMNATDCILPDWPAPARVRTLITTRSGGVSTGTRGALNLGKSVGDDPSNVAENRQRVSALVGATPRWMGQVHGVEVADIDAIPFDVSITADAQVARLARNVCTVMTADCLPLLFCDRAATVVGAAHAGWRGLAAGVIESTITAMRVSPENLLVYLGPAIGPEAFEVGDDVRDAFINEYAMNASNSTIGGQFQDNARNALSGAVFRRDAGQAFEALTTAVQHAFRPHPNGIPGKWLCDIYALARVRLKKMGVDVAQIFGGTHCTFTDETRFFSHRRSTHRQEPSGRMASMIWLAD
jgi:polyphenol oxidase